MNKHSFIGSYDSYHSVPPKASVLHIASAKGTVLSHTHTHTLQTREALTPGWLIPDWPRLRRGAKAVLCSLSGA